MRTASQRGCCRVNFFDKALAFYAEGRQEMRDFGKSTMLTVAVLMLFGMIFCSCSNQILAGTADPAKAVVIQASTGNEIAGFLLVPITQPLPPKIAVHEMDI